jgi:murein DD-endopeptidase MepM/ murein hydrolase activator NlpD
MSWLLASSENSIEQRGESRGSPAATEIAGTWLQHRSIRVIKEGCRRTIMTSTEHLKRRGGLALTVVLLLAGTACTTTERPGRSGEVVIGYDDAGQPKTLMLKPVDGGRLTSRFGLRTDPMGGGGTRRHLGTDYGARKGSPVRAAGDGVVASAGRRGSYGNYVLIRHDHTYATGYAHLSGYADGLWSGRRVRQGQVIGYVGSTGRSTGPHLHYEVYVDGERVDPYDL